MLCSVQKIFTISYTLYSIAISRNLMAVVSGIVPNSIGFTNSHVQVEPVQIQPEEVR